MLTFKFQMAFNGTMVAEGTASAVMTHYFQSAFYESIGPVEEMKGKLSTLDSLLNRKVGEHDSWVAQGADKSRFACFMERIN